MKGDPGHWLLLSGISLVPYVEKHLDITSVTSVPGVSIPVTLYCWEGHLLLLGHLLQEEGQMTTNGPCEGSTGSMLGDVKGGMEDEACTCNVGGFR